MDGARWKQVQSLFHEVADLPEKDRRAHLLAECGGDNTLMADVLAMLEEDNRGASMLDTGVAHVASHLVGTAAPAVPAIPDFGPYRIREVLGEGGMGVVYLAERADLGSLVAVKVLRDAWVSTARRERFRSEQRTLAQLNHPFIARLYDADTLPDGTPWFAMEYVDGVPLTGYCRNLQSSLRDRLDLFRQVCDAVQYAHENAVIHRDLKPSNILVKAGGAVRLLDFGIAKQLDTLDTPVDHTRTGLRLMTPAYAAPEQVLGGPIGVYTDVYALGVILYELLSGRSPFDLSNRSAGEIEQIIVSQEPERPSMAAPETVQLALADKTSWADLDVLCLTAMHKDPQRRYRTVEALIRDIHHYLHGEPLEARPDSLRYRAGKFVRRSRRSLAVTAAVLTVILGLVVFFTARLAMARNVALAEAARTQRIQHFVLNLFEGGDEAAGPADSLRVVTLLDRGVAEARSLDREPEVQAELYQTLGGIYRKLGKLDRADALFEAALDRRRALFGPEHREVAESLVALGSLRVDQARLSDAEQLVRQGLAMSRRIFPTKHPAVARATAALGIVLEHRGDYDQAITLLDEAIRAQSLPGSSQSDLATSLSELANTQFYAGRYAISDSLNRRVLEMHRQIHGSHHPSVADDLSTLAPSNSTWAIIRKPRSSRARRWTSINRWYGNNHPETAASLTFLSQALIREDRYDEADGLLRRALAIQEAVYGKVHPRVATTLGELATLAMKRGNLDEAEAGFRATAENFRAVHGDKHYTVAIALSNLASVYLEKKEYARAERLFKEVIERYKVSLSADHLTPASRRSSWGMLSCCSENIRKRSRTAWPAIPF